jgi:hypothetical protein
MPKRRISLYGSELKRFILEGRIDKENKKIRTVREFLKKEGYKIGFDTRPSNYAFWCRHPEVVNAEPYFGEPISDKLILRYAKDMNYFHDTLKVVRMIALELGMDKNMIMGYSADVLKDAILTIYNMGEYMKARQNVLKKRISDTDDDELSKPIEEVGGE